MGTAYAVGDSSTPLSNLYIAKMTSNLRCLFNSQADIKANTSYRVQFDLLIDND